MKKTYILLFLTLTVICATKGQVNPINNLKWDHTYEYPNNCFNLSWTEPDSSLTDTLVGYNIYRDNNLYTFTTDLYHGCNPCVGVVGQAFCDFLSFQMGQFYIHVTAVYNHNHIESIYTDSIYNEGIAIGIKDVSPNDALKISTIIQEKSSILVELNQSVENGTLIITTITGQIKTINLLKNQKKIEIDISDYNMGIYIITLKTNKENLSCKILIK